MNQKTLARGAMPTGAMTHTVIQGAPDGKVRHSVEHVSKTQDGGKEQKLKIDFLGGSNSTKKHL